MIAFQRWCVKCKRITGWARTVAFERCMNCGARYELADPEPEQKEAKPVDGTIVYVVAGNYQQFLDYVHMAETPLTHRYLADVNAAQGIARDAVVIKVGTWQDNLAIVENLEARGYPVYVPGGHDAP